MKYALKNTLRSFVSLLIAVGFCMLGYVVTMELTTPWLCNLTGILTTIGFIVVADFIRRLHYDVKSIMRNLKTEK